MAAPLIALLPTLVDKLADVADRLHLSGEEKAQLMLEYTRLQRDVIAAEARSEHVLTATWRPILMLVCTAVIANNWLIAPYVSVLTGVDLALPMPPELWKLLYIGIGGYVVGRSAEKIVRSTRKGDA